MARITRGDADGAQYLRALENRACAGYVVWEERALEWVRKNLRTTYRGVEDEMCAWIQTGKVIHRVDEQRENWAHLWFYHYDLRIPLDGRTIYIETRLDPDDDPQADARILVVNVHAA